jgi:hypothetical protein
MSEGKFTWSNNQKPPTLERLDRFLVSKSWENIFPLVLVYKLPRERSDLNPLILTLPVKQQMKILNFRFELSWLKHPDFLWKVEELWKKNYHNMPAFDRIQHKLEIFKKFFKGWGFNLQGENRRGENC